MIWSGRKRRYVSRTLVVVGAAALEAFRFDDPLRCCIEQSFPDPRQHKPTAFELPQAGQVARHPRLVSRRSLDKAEATAFIREKLLRLRLLCREPSGSGLSATVHPECDVSRDGAM